MAIKVILAEASYGSRRYVVDFLARTGLEVMSASSNDRITSEFLRQEQPDVVVLKIGDNDNEHLGMPFLGDLRLAEPNLGIIAIGPAEVDWTVLALDAGADDYLPYGSDPAVLAARIQALARRVGRSRK